MYTPVFLASGGLIFAFEHSNWEGKLIILILLFASIFSWSVMWTKIQSIRQAVKQNQLFLRQFRKAKTPLSLYQQKLEFSASPLFAVYQAGSRELTYHLLGSSEVDETFAPRLADSTPLSEREMASVRSAMERAIGEQMLTLESHLVLLATAVSGAPFLGLLGTVWGVMDAFSGVAMAGKASLAAMAPGVSGSLITTVVGLCVAIPAMFGYNYLINDIRRMTIEMENFSNEVASTFEHHYSRS